MRILYLASDWGLSLRQDGGAGSHMRGTIKGFRENGCEVLPVIGGDFLNLEWNHSGQEGQEGNVKFLSKPQPKGLKRLMPDKLRLLLREIRYLLKSRKLESAALKKIEEFQPEVIYERSGYFSFMGNRIARRLRIPLFLETDGCMIEVINSAYGVFSVGLGNKIEKIKLNKAEYVVVYNRYSISNLDRKFSLIGTKKVVKPLGIDVPENTDKVPSPVKESLGINRSNLVVGFVGTFAPYQGVKYLIEAAVLLKAKGIGNVSFLLVGWGNNAGELKAYAESNNLTNVIFAGKVNKADVNKYLSFFDIAIVPDAEPTIYPIKTLEYGIFASCPLVPDYEVFSEIIKEGVNGYMFRHQDPASIAERIIHLSNNPGSIREAGLRWQQTVTSEFTWKNVVLDTISAMQESIRPQHT
jgi:glycosyltransferase involved in cell wall biosynthesis